MQVEGPTELQDYVHPDTSYIDIHPTHANTEY